MADTIGTNRGIILNDQDILRAANYFTTTEAAVQMINVDELAEVLALLDDDSLKVSAAMPTQHKTLRTLLMRELKERAGKPCCATSMSASKTSDVDKLFNDMFGPSESMYALPQDVIHALLPSAPANLLKQLYLKSNHDVFKQAVLAELRSRVQEET